MLTPQQPEGPGEKLRPYVAGLVIDWLASAPDVRHRAIDGSLAFVDISGFTTLTERLATKGKVGAEEMSDVLDAAFGALLEVAYSYGALLVKWGGDAVLLLFEGDEHALLACRAAAEMRQTMRRIGVLQTSVGSIRLRMSVGVHSGAFDFFLVGDRHRELLITGPGATTTAHMEATADAGEIVVSSTTAARLPARCVGVAKGDGWLLRSAPAVDPRCRFWPRAPQTVDLGICLDPVVREHLLGDAGDSEHRQVSVGFVEVTAVDDLLLRQGPGAVAAALHQLMALVQDECGRHHVTFWETDISKDGFKVMLVSGAPSSSGHDDEGLLRAARSILDLHDGPLRVRIGVNTGRVFSGQFGPAFRRTLSVKGDAVNLAARVMSKAEPGQLLATQALLDRVHLRVRYEALPPFMVKGKRRVVHAAVVHSIERVHHVGRPALPLIGRDDEVRLVLDEARAALTGQGKALRISGEPGIGKSRLVDHVCQRLPDELTVVRAFADDYDATTPYFVIRQVLRAALGLQGEPSETATLSTLRQCLEAAPALLAWLPLLVVPFGVGLPDNKTTAALEGKFRRQRVATLTVELLSLACRTPTVFVVEDVHSADEASVELLARIADVTAQRPWVLLTLGRAPSTAVDADPAAARATSPAELVVTALADGDARLLVLSTPAGQQLAPHRVQLIVQRGQGNPLFLQELTVASGMADDGELPSTLEELLAAQLDALGPQQRHVVRVASVLGVRFEDDLVEQLMGTAVDEATWRQVERFIAVEQPGIRRFRTGLARDAAYQGLPFRRRVQLHGRAATALEERWVGRGDDVAEALSLHSAAAQRFEPAWHYSLIAARRARDVYANADALTFFDRARQAAKRLPDLPAIELAEMLESIGDVHGRLADLDLAAAAYREARRRAPVTAGLLRARVALNLGLVAERAGAIGRATRWLSMAQRDLVALGESAGEMSAAIEIDARIAVERAFVQHTVGRERQARTLCLRAVEAAETVGADAVAGRALLLLDMIDLRVGDGGDEARVMRALELFERAGDLPRQAGTWNHLGMGAYFRGEWDLARERYERARTTHERSGDEWSAAIASANIGEILVEQGRLAEAEPLVAEALRVWRASGTVSDIGFATGLLGRLHVRRGAHAKGMALLAESVASYSVKDERFEVVESELRQVEAVLLQQQAADAVVRLDYAEAKLRRALRLAGVGEGSDAVSGTELPPTMEQAVTLLRLRGFAAAQLGDVITARASFDRSLELARTRGVAYEIAQSLRALVWLAGEHNAVAELAEAERLCARLGIVWTPTMPMRTVIVRSDQVVTLPQQFAADEVVDA